MSYNLTGLNVDWEPTTAATEEDAQAYAKFLNSVRRHTHTHLLFLLSHDGGYV